MVANFFRRSNDGASRLEKELAELESQVQSASPGYETQFLNRAGNLCVDAGQSARALGFYGRAIDAYLESGRFSAAEVLCRKVLQIAPQAVRVRCTLAWLAIGKGSSEGTRDEIAGYVAAAEKAGQEAFAEKQLSMMAEAATDMDLRQTIAEHLLSIEAAQAADHVYGLIFEERNGLRPKPLVNEGKLWAKLLRAALMGPLELKEQSWANEEESDVLPSLVREERS